MCTNHILMQNVLTEACKHDLLTVASQKSTHVELDVIHR